MRLKLLVLLCVALSVGCDGSLQPVTSHQETPADSDQPADAKDLGAPPAGDMSAMPPREDMGEGPQEPPAEHPNTLIQERLFTCDGSRGSSPARIRRVESYEWAKSIADDRGEQVPFLPGSGHDYSTYSGGESMDASILREYLRLNHLPAGSWKDVHGNGSPRLVNLRGAGSLADQVRCFQWNWNDKPVEEDPSPQCINKFVTMLLEHGVLFRPPSQEEVTALVDFTKAQLIIEKADPAVTRRDTIEVIIRAAWLSAGALFRSELGEDASPEGATPRKLTDWELAGALSLAMTDHAAGLSKRGYGNDSYEHKVMLYDVQQAAQDGTLSQPEVIERLARRYLAGADPATADPEMSPSDYPPNSGAYSDQYWMSAKLQRFFREWLGYADAASIFKDTPGASSRFESKALFINEHPDGSALNFRHPRYMENSYNSASLATLLDDTIARVVAEDKDVLANLLTTRRFLIKPASKSNPYPGALYNHNVYTDGEIAGALADRWRELPATERAGVLTHPAWLAAHGGNFENDPSAIHRGKWVYEELLCGLVPPVPITVDAMLDPATSGQSARERLTSQLDERAECAGCHKIMNPLGYTFEIYNHAGFVRAEDHGAAPNGMATLEILPPNDPVLMSGLIVRDAVDMMDYFSRSPRVKRCFIRQSFRYFMGRSETYADACSLAKMEQAYDERGSMIQMLTALFQSDAFLYRHTPQEQSR